MVVWYAVHQMWDQMVGWGWWLGRCELLQRPSPDEHQIISQDLGETWSVLCNLSASLAPVCVNDTPDAWLNVGPGAGIQSLRRIDSARISFCLLGTMETTSTWQYDRATTVERRASLPRTSQAGLWRYWGNS